ncbi:MAG: MOSC domain-containing protein, partial [Acidimicrobiales bacterium]
DVRRFRPNLVVDAPGSSPFGEDQWCGIRLRIGSAVIEGMQPTVRCAMPLRAQPGLDAQPTLFKAMDSLHANHLGIYLNVIESGEIRVGDRVGASS